MRDLVTGAKRVVVKIGSSSLTTTSGGLDATLVDYLVDALAARKSADVEVVLVSSGAIAAGLAPLGFLRRPRNLAQQQAAASVGQGLLVNQYTKSFDRYGIRVGQVLLTADDLIRRVHYRNAHQTLDTLLTLGALPIVNENDTVATDEIRFGDNDRLAALVAALVRADLLVLLSDVDALYTEPPGTPGAVRVEEVREASDLDAIHAGKAGSSGVGTGGMATKVDAAHIATTSGIPVVLTSAELAAEALAGQAVGTYFHPSHRRPPTRLFWLAHATEPRGRLHLDAGAVTAIVARRASLLPAGVTAVDGLFSAGDPVDLVDGDGRAVARGLVNFDAAELPELLGHSTRELEPGYRRELVHRDDMVLL
ncbi:MAG: glutamate 5-kinase [Longispora sp.]|nr:glutamate 5-kinase [Longispora sp. (in: high G+C Gram-positive bacteria)]